MSWAASFARSEGFVGRRPRFTFDHSIPDCRAVRSPIRTNPEHNHKTSLGMVRIDKSYFTLRETAARWELAMEDLGYLAENGDLRC